MFHLLSNKDKEWILERTYVPYERRLATFITTLFSLPKTETVVDLIGELERSLDTRLSTFQIFSFLVLPALSMIPPAAL